MDQNDQQGRQPAVGDVGASPENNNPARDKPPTGPLRGLLARLALLAGVVGSGTAAVAKRVLGKLVQSFRSRPIAVLGGISTALAAIVFAISLVALWDETRVNIAVRSADLPAAFVDRGYRPETLLREVVATLPGKLSEFEARYNAQRALDVQIVPPLEVGNERFCPETTIGSLVELSPEMFSPDGVRDIRIVEGDEFSGSPVRIALDAVRWVRRQFGYPYMTVELGLTERGGETHVLEVLLHPVSGSASRHIEPARFEMPTLLTRDSDPRPVFQEALLRIAAPEITAMFRGARNTRTLDIERFLAAEYPTPESEISILFARLFMAANSDGHESHKSPSRIVYLAGELEQKPRPTQLITPDKLPMLVRQHIAMASVISPLGITSPDLAELMLLAGDFILEPLAKEHDKTLVLLREEAHNENGLQREIRDLVIADMQLKAFLSYGLDAVDGLRSHADAAIALAMNASAPNSEAARAVLRINAVFYVAYTLERALSQLNGEGDAPAEARSALETILDFYGSSLPRSIAGRPLFEPSELAFLEVLVSFAQFHAGDRADALNRIERAAQNLPDCNLAAVGSQLRNIAEQANELERTRILELAYRTLAQAEARGLRSLGFYNAYGSTADAAEHDEVALKAYKKAALYDGDRHWVESNRGWLHARRGEYAEAERAFRDALDTTLAMGDTEEERWGDIDAAWNKQWSEARAKAIEIHDYQEPEMPWISEHPICSRETLDHPRAYTSAVDGLLLSISKQDDPKEFLRVYKEYEQMLACSGAYSSPDRIAGYLQYVNWHHCAGNLDEMPIIPVSLAPRFAMIDGSPACGAPVQASQPYASQVGAEPGDR